MGRMGDEMKRLMMIFVCAAFWGCNEPNSPAEPNRIETPDMGEAPPPFEPPDRIIRIPGDTSQHSICDEGDILQTTGGDFYEMSDRIVFGEVSAVEVVPDGVQEDCNPSTYSWMLKVSLNVQSNFKGDGDSLDVYMNPSGLYWDSIAIYRHNGRWLPDQDVVVQVLEDLGYSGETGIQVGQELLVFTQQTDAGWHSGARVVPLAERVDGLLTFQTESFGCVEFPESLQTPFTLETLAQELMTAPVPENAGFRRNQRAGSAKLPPRSFCQVESAPPEPNDAGSLESDAGM